nr:uncharacterized protein LOC123286515 [Equus asinus]
MLKPLQICIGADLGAPLVGGCERGGAGLREPGSGADLAFEPRPRCGCGPAPSQSALAAPPAASGGHPGRCDPAALGAATAVAAGTSRRCCPEGHGALGCLLAALWPATRSLGGCRWMRSGQEDFGLSCPECFPSASAFGAALVPENSEETRRGRRTRTLQTCAAAA